MCCCLMGVYSVGNRGCTRSSEFGVDGVGWGKGDCCCKNETRRREMRRRVGVCWLVGWFS